MLRTFNWEMFRNERGACGSRCSSISVSGKEKAVEKLVWFSGESPEGRRNVDPLEGPPYWEGSLDFAGWASFASMLRKTGRVVGEVGLSSGCICDGEVVGVGCTNRLAGGDKAYWRALCSSKNRWCPMTRHALSRWQRMPFDLSSLNKGTSCRRSFCSGRLKSSFKNISVPLSFFGQTWLRFSWPCFSCVRGEAGVEETQTQGSSCRLPGFGVGGQVSRPPAHHPQLSSCLACYGRYSKRRLWGFLPPSLSPQSPQGWLLALTSRSSFRVLRLCLWVDLSLRGHLLCVSPGPAISSQTWSGLPPGRWGCAWSSRLSKSPSPLWLRSSPFFRGMAPRSQPRPPVRISHHYLQRVWLSLGQNHYSSESSQGARASVSFLVPTWSPEKKKKLIGYFNRKKLKKG